MRADRLNDRPRCAKCPRDANHVIRRAGEEYHLCPECWRRMKRA